METVPGARRHVPAAARRMWPRFMRAAARHDALPAETGLRCAALQGYSHWYIDGNLRGEEPSGFSASRLQALHTAIAHNGVQPIYHGSCRSMLGSRERARADAGVTHVLDEIELCNALGGAPLVLHGGGVSAPQRSPQARARALQQAVETLRPLVDIAATRGVPVWMESLCGYMRFHPFDYLCTTEEEVTSMLEQVPRLCCFLDVSNAWMNGGDPVAMFRRLHHRIVGLCISDLDRCGMARHAAEHATPPVCRLLAAADALEWSGIIAFTAETTDVRTGLHDLDQLLRRTPP
ncbi:TIM barrel protein [Stenotrophomonas sp. C3(2023)]|uniref:sugar phosphate isomerase/epimerase family protein n=1 Tax=Stenotrophomonas sp. C3(2023) TaxID=3080277 RepID=UPI00293C1524|nr:TIM barrel protein [Stenotrophomonas sp. C3(2023)]MDV3470003.1 TIM barrel protein [Stenotrophomonas sp. C3(2023)]